MNRVSAGLSYLNSLKPWNGRGGFSLTELKEVLKRLGDPQDLVPAVHVAGTNGKGSVTAAVASILGRCGYSVGMNISPHLERINERIVIDGKECSDEFLGEFAYAVRQAATRAVVELSFHEAITALAFLGLAENKMDWSVIEVGLGGRLDASNVISRPAATAIVTISFDHQAILGDSLAKIAREKAGIIKPGAPLVTGAVGQEADVVISGLAKGVPHYKFGRDFDVRPSGVVGEHPIGFLGKGFPGADLIKFEFSSALRGRHQAHNLGVAAAVGCVLGMPVDGIKGGLEGVFWPGRLEVGEVSGREVVLDCAHNEAGIASFTSFLESRGARDIDLTFGVLDTKNWRAMVKGLLPYVGVWRLLTPDSDRALQLEEVRREIEVSCTGVRIECYGADYQGWARDILSQGELGAAYITGSMYMVGKVRELLSMAKRPIWAKSANGVL